MRKNMQKNMKKNGKRIKIDRCYCLSESEIREVIITRHARSRFRERMPVYKSAPDETVDTILKNCLRYADKASINLHQSIYKYNGIGVVTKRDGDIRVMVTVIYA